MSEATSEQGLHWAWRRHVIHQTQSTFTAREAAISKGRRRMLLASSRSIQRGAPLCQDMEHWHVLVWLGLPTHALRHRGRGRMIARVAGELAGMHCELSRRFALLKEAPASCDAEDGARSSTRSQITFHLCLSLRISLCTCGSLGVMPQTSWPRRWRFNGISREILMRLPQSIEWLLSAPHGSRGELQASTASRPPLTVGSRIWWKVRAAGRLPA